MYIVQNIYEIDLTILDFVHVANSWMAEIILWFLKNIRDT